MRGLAPKTRSIVLRIVARLLTARFGEGPVDAAGINLSAQTAGVAALAFNSMVFVSEILRAGLGTLDPGQVEAARSGLDS
ncbi:hypothetical protein J8I87_28670 [Paraburkholderia sp. LEh10]|uniref:hypothetical protein n=1 Tax=Paraburkholderia sp. LEh10 TaxID=2821353 RepID=UPI001AE99144|nr:hypothetical protein [Paraburkholderia sp. LEh10]MBP0593595.1 hypothetical protein [Paraburkholderia sp. LEh10]